MITYIAIRAKLAVYPLTSIQSTEHVAILIGITIIILLRLQMKILPSTQFPHLRDKKRDNGTVALVAKMLRSPHYERDVCRLHLDKNIIYKYTRQKYINVIPTIFTILLATRKNIL